MAFLYDMLEWMMDRCYGLAGNYGLAIILFTLLSKIILFPVSIWVQKNSIKMVKMQPEINFMKVKFYGDDEAIAQEQSDLFKREKYHPMASVVPLLIQLVLLMGLIEVIKGGIGNLAIDMGFMGMDLSKIPSQSGARLLFGPVLAGLSAWILCMAQNASNVLQSEQSHVNQYGTMAFSVGLSLYLGWFVPLGVALYWIASNLMAVAQLYLLNWMINPKDYVDYEQLEKSKEALLELKTLGVGKKKLFGDPNGKREREDYKRFFSVVNKHLVFYSESSGFYKYYQGMIEYLLEKTNLVIHYITSDPGDRVFELGKNQERLRTYYIGERKLITLMMKMDADVVVMTMPDLDNFHIKRSYVRKDIEYIYVPHGMDSLNLTMRTGSMDHYDTVFCTGRHQKEEIEKTEAVYGLPKKRLVEWGYCLLDRMREDYAAAHREEDQGGTILIAPSWQKDNIIDSCIDEMLDQLKDMGYKIVVRPHPQQVKHEPERMEGLKSRWRENQNIEIQTDFSSNSTVFQASLMITDWSGIAYEYAFTTCKPVLFIDVPMKVMNPEYQKIDTEPINIWMREKIGRVLKPGQMDEISVVAGQMLDSADIYYREIDSFVHEYVYHLGESAKVGAKYMIGAIQEKMKSRTKNENGNEK